MAKPRRPAQEDQGEEEVHVNKKEPPLVACMRVSHPDKLVTVGSTKTPCVRCGEEVWIAQSSLRRAPVVHAVCLECCQDELAEVVSGKRDLSPMTDEQAYEIIATLSAKGDA